MGMLVLPPSQVVTRRRNEMKILVHCDDGSDRNCHGKVETEIPFDGLRDNNVSVNWIDTRDTEEVESVTITPPAPVEQWVLQNRRTLDAHQIDSIKATGSFTLEYTELESVVCGACGSDQTYDADGKNITSD
jgi:hypothetical protein